jgi:hypothetical protein
MAGLVAKILINGDWVELGVRYSGAVNNPVLSAAVVKEFRALADDYMISLSDVIPGVSAEVTVACSPANPYNGRTGSVALDGSTQEMEIIPGVSIVFSNDLDIDETSTIILTVGLPVGVLKNYPPYSGQRQEFMIQVENTGLAAGSDCKARRMTVMKAIQKVGTIFEDIRPFAEAAQAKLTDDIVSPYLFEVSNVTGSGSAKEMDVEMDGSLFEVLNLTTNEVSMSEGLNVNHYYRHTDDLLVGKEFRLSELAVNGDQENVLAFEPDMVELAPNDNGAPADFDIADVPLTPENQLAGVMPAASVAYFFLGINVNEFSNVSSPYPCCIALEGSALQAANWSE